MSKRRKEGEQRARPAAHCPTQLVNHQAWARGAAHRRRSRNSGQPQWEARHSDAPQGCHAAKRTPGNAPPRGRKHTGQMPGPVQHSSKLKSEDKWLHRGWDLVATPTGCVEDGEVSRHERGASHTLLRLPERCSALPRRKQEHISTMGAAWARPFPTPPPATRAQPQERELCYCHPCGRWGWGGVMSAWKRRRSKDV